MAALYVANTKLFRLLRQHAFFFPTSSKAPRKKKDIKLAKSSLLLCFPMKNVVHKSEQFCSNMFQLFRGIQISQPQTNTTSVTAA